MVGPLSKVIEKVIALRITMHFSDQRLVDYFSVGVSRKFLLKPSYCTLQELLYVTSAIKTAKDNEEGTTLVLVDFTAAFDTFRNSILIRR